MLQERMRLLRVHRNRSTQLSNRTVNFLLNVGTTSLTPSQSRMMVDTWVNHPEAVAKAVNKLRTFEALSPEITPPWTVDPLVAREWGSPVVCRHLLTSHSGRGIEIVGPGVDIPDAPLYTKYIKKTSEWRVHVAFGEVIDVTRKIRDPNREVTDWQVRNHSNGFIFARESGEPPSPSITLYALEAIKALGLDFGAVDIVWSNYYQRAYVLEVNSAPGMEGQTLDAYVEAFEARIEEMMA